MDTQLLSFTDDEDVISYFTDSQCPALAYEIHQLTGWTIAMVSSQPAGSPDYMGHVFIMDSDGMVIDIKGKRTLEEVQNDWYFCGYTHRFFTLKDFEFEMRDWDMTSRFDRDRKAKYWAKKIVEMLNE